MPPHPPRHKTSTLPSRALPSACQCPPSKKNAAYDHPNLQHRPLKSSLRPRHWSPPSATPLGAGEHLRGLHQRA
eukprot:2327993-Alexandrium_andersonii.AAC.1